VKKTAAARPSSVAPDVPQFRGAPVRAHVERLVSALEKRGARPTQQRRVVYAAVARRTDHPTVEAIHLEARRRVPGMSLATVYSTLDLLTEAGLVRRVPGPDGSARYDARTDAHDHRRCLGCGRIDDLERPGHPVRLENYQDPRFRVIDYRVEIVGYCAGCETKGDR
jgi:Fur family transcriptional regulator, peroxide stress response regulator